VKCRCCWNLLNRLVFLHDRNINVYVRGSCSEYIDVTSGVLYGSVWGMSLLDICTKIWTAIMNADGAVPLQQDLNTLGDWLDKWLLKFNLMKCKVMHIGSWTHHYMRLEVPWAVCSGSKECSVLGMLSRWQMRSTTSKYFIIPTAGHRHTQNIVTLLCACTVSILQRH